MSVGRPRCVEVVEPVTGYLDGALPSPLNTAVAEHLRGCPGRQVPMPSPTTAVLHLTDATARGRAHPRIDRVRGPLT